MFDLDATIELSDAARAIGTNGGPACTVSFFSRNTRTLDQTILGTAVTRRDGPEANSLRATLPRVVLPRGRYRLAMVAELSAPNAGSSRRAYLQGPVIELS